MTASLPRVTECALRQNRKVRPAGLPDPGWIARTKHDHLVVPAGTQIVREGALDQTLYTVFDGWAVRYRHAPGGARQILDVLLPGDSFGFAAVLLGASTYFVQAVTLAGLCVLDGRQVTDLLSHSPKLALSILRDRLQEEHRSDQRLTMLGRMSAEERVGWFLIAIYDRLRARGMADGTSCPFPLRRIDVADAVGLSKVHIIRALRSLRSQLLLDIKGRDLIIPDMAKLAAYTGYVALAPGPTKTVPQRNKAHGRRHMRTRSGVDRGS